MMMNKFARVSMAALAVVLATMPAKAESLQDAVQMTVTSHPEIGVVSNDRRAIDEELNQAKGLFLPQVDVRGDMGFGWSDRRGDGNTTDDGDILPNAAAQISLQQMLFDGFNASSEVDRQENRIRSAAHRVRETAELTGLDATEAYLNVLRARQLLEAAQSNLDAHRELQTDIERRARGGAGNQADVEQANARIAQAEATLAQVQGDLRDAESRYNSVVGRFPADLTRPVVSLTYMPSTEEEAVQSAIKDNPTLAIRQSDVSVADAELKQTKATFYPQVTLEGTASRQKDLGGLRLTKDEAGAGMVMRWNLYRGGADTAREQEYLWRQAEAQSQVEATRREVEESMRRAWVARDAARIRAERFANQYDANSKVLVAYKKQFDAGERTLLDVLDAQNELFNAKANLLTAYYTALFGDYQVLAERGALLASLDVAQPTTASVVSEQQVTR